MERLIGTIKPSADRMGDVMGLMAPDQLRERLCRINHQLGRNKVFAKGGAWRFVAVDGHEFFWLYPEFLKWKPTHNGINKGIEHQLHRPKFVGDLCRKIQIADSQENHSPVILIKTAAANRAHGEMRSYIRPLKSIIRPLESFRRWIWVKWIAG